MPDSAPLDRRQWLKAAALTVAGAALSPHLTGSEKSSSGGPLGAAAPGFSADQPPRENSHEGRQYFPCFEIFPPV